MKPLVYSCLFTACFAGGSAIAAPPAWWSAGDPPVIDPGAPDNNKGPANIGQAKWMAKNALEALRAVDANTANAIEADLVGPTKPISSWNPGQNGNNAPLLIGQLKAISAPFYVHLNGRAPTWLANQKLEAQTDVAGSLFPWASATGPQNKAMANIGQLKAVFSLHFDQLLLEGEADLDGDGMPDSFEWGIILTDPNDPYTDLVSFTAEADADGDGLSNIREFQIGSNCLSADTDGDGMTDGFEEAYFSVAAVLDNGAAFPDFGPNGDQDADSKTNLAEFQEGSIPILSDELAPLPNQGGPIIEDGKLRWFGVSGAIYRLRYSADLSLWETYPTLMGGANRWIEIQLSDLRYPVPTLGAFEIESWAGSADADGDGLPNIWEFSNGLSVFANDAAADSDGDGLSNLEEYQQSLDPRNRDSDGDGYEDKLSIGLAGYWRLDEESGSSAADRTGGGNHGALIPAEGTVGAAEWGEQGILNGGLTFAATTADPRLSLPASILNGTTEASVSAWFKTAEVETSNYSRCLVSAVALGGSQQLVIRLERTVAGLQITATTGNSASPLSSWSVGWPLDDASWHHIVLTRTSTNLQLFVDSVDLGVRATALSPLSIGEGGLLIGQAQSNSGSVSAGSGWEGSIDEIRIYRQAIAPQYSPGLYSPDDSDGDQLSDAWEMKWFGNLAQKGTEDSDLDGVTNAAEYQAGSSPADFFDGKIPLVEVTAGSSQEVARGGVSQLIKFRVSVPSTANPSVRVPVEGVPVSLQALTTALGAVPGRLSFSEDGTHASNQKAAITDSLGEVGVYFIAH